MVVAFNIIYINIYELFVIDISVEDCTPEGYHAEAIRYKHESFQMYESSCTGILLDNNCNDFVHINKDGLWVVSLSAGQDEEPDKRVLTDERGFQKTIHSLESAGHLQLDVQNFLMFSHDQGDQIVSIRQEYVKKDYQDDDRKHAPSKLAEWILYEVRLSESTLRDLMIIKSLYLCRRDIDIFNIVKEQPYPELFFKSFFELDFSNMATILAFEPRSVEYLLDEENKEWFEKRVKESYAYPLFYKNKLEKHKEKGKYFYRNAIDIAMRCN